MRLRIALTGALVALLAACPGPSKTTETQVPDRTNGDKSDKTHPAPKTIEGIFAARCREGLEKARKQLPELLAVGGTRTIENTAEPYNLLLINMQESQAVAGSMQSVHPNPKIRDAARACEQEVEKFASGLKLNRKLYEAFSAIDTSAADPETKRFVAHTLRDLRRAGVDRDEKTRKRLSEIDDQLTKLGQGFSKAIIEDVRHIELTSVKQLEGMPADYIKAHQPDANGKIKITTNYPDMVPFLAYAKDDGLRKKLFIANRSRGGEENEKRLREILVLRQEKAKLLGFANWADYITGDKMIKSGANAAAFIERLVKTAKKRTERDYKELLARLRKEMKGAKRVEDWQKYYLDKKVKKESYAFDAQSVRPYFPYNQVQKGLLDITSKIYGITYVPAKNVDLWHPSVKAYEVLRDGSKIGRIFLDMHPREGKYKHAAMFPMRNGVKGKQLPIGALVCNFPSGDALMEHNQVKTMFHEFGHLMHHIFGGHKRWLDQAGVSTEWDFVEAPSMMFEEWALSHETLKLFAKHHKTGEVIPAETVKRMVRAEKFGVGAFVTGQAFYAAISLEFHRADPKTFDMTKLVREMQNKMTPFRFVEGTRFHASFGHLNGYSAIYYTYMWSLVIAKDLLTPFEKHGLLNTTWTHRYRDKILAPGGSKDAADLVKDFLGREYNFKAFEKYLTE